MTASRRALLAALGAAAAAGPAPPEPDPEPPYRRDDGALVFDADVLDEIEREHGPFPDLAEALTRATREGFAADGVEP